MFNCHSTPTSPRQKPYGIINTQLVYHILVLKSSPTVSLLMSISSLPFVTLIFQQLLFGCATRLWGSTESWEWGRLVKVSLVAIWCFVCCWVRLFRLFFNHSSFFSSPSAPIPPAMPIHIHTALLRSTGIVLASLITSSSSSKSSQF